MDRGSQLSKDDEDDEDDEDDKDDKDDKEDEEEERRTRQEESEEEEKEEEKEEEEEATDIKSNNPHLAGGEKNKTRRWGEDTETWVLSVRVFPCFICFSHGFPYFPSWISAVLSFASWLLGRGEVP